MKICNKCGLEKETTVYCKDPRNKDGLQGICLVCKRGALQIRKALRRQGIGLVQVRNKSCNACGENKPIEDFFRDAGFADGHASICKVCKTKNGMDRRNEKRDEYNAYMREYRKTDKEHFKDVDLRRTYGITLIQYNQMLTAQNGVCAKCGRPPSGKRPLAVDHDPTTTKATGIRVRALLCYKCNRDQHVFDNRDVHTMCSEYDTKHKKPT